MGSILCAVGSPLWSESNEVAPATDWRTVLHKYRSTDSVPSSTPSVPAPLLAAPVLHAAEFRQETGRNKLVAQVGKYLEAQAAKNQERTKTHFGTVVHEGPKFRPSKAVEFQTMWVTQFGIPIAIGIAW